MSSTGIRRTAWTLAVAAVLGMAWPAAAQQRAGGQGGSLAGGQTGGSQLGGGGATFSGGSAGGAFGSGGGSFGGGTGSFSGGGSFAGSTTGTGPTQSNPFAAYYANPYAGGLPNGSTNVAFGQPLYRSTGTGGQSTVGSSGFSGGGRTGSTGGSFGSTGSSFGSSGGSFGGSGSSLGGSSLGGSSLGGSSLGGSSLGGSSLGGSSAGGRGTGGTGGSTFGSGSTGGRGTTGRTSFGGGSAGLGGTGGLGGSTGTIAAPNTGSNPANVSFSTAGTRRAPAFITAVEFDRPPVAPPAQIRTDLGQTLARSSTLSGRGNIQVNMEGRTAVLRGEVADSRASRLAEAMSRLTPGVREVRNELRVRTPSPAGGQP